MKLMRIVFACFCLLIAGAALMNIASTPNDQPFKDLSAIICLSITAFGAFRKSRNLMYAFPAFLLVTTGINFANASNINFALGGIAGALIPLGAWFLIHRNIGKSKITTKETTAA